MSTICAGLIEKDGRYLLIKAKTGRPKGMWNNPGGHKDEGETIEEAVQREVKEETGFEVSVGELVGIYVLGETRKSLYVTEIIGGELEIPQDEISEAKWFTIEEIRTLDNSTFGAVQGPTDHSQGNLGKTYSADRLP